MLDYLDKKVAETRYRQLEHEARIERLLASDSEPSRLWLHLERWGELFIWMGSRLKQAAQRRALFQVKGGNA